MQLSGGQKINSLNTLGVQKNVESRSSIHCLSEYKSCRLGSSLVLL